MKNESCEYKWYTIGNGSEFEIVVVVVVPYSLSFQQQQLRKSSLRYVVGVYKLENVKKKIFQADNKTQSINVKLDRTNGGWEIMNNDGRKSTFLFLLIL